MGFLNRDTLLNLAAGNGLKPKAITLPGIDESVYIARLTAGQVDSYQEEIRKTDRALVRGTILRWALVDADNKRLFTAEDVGTLVQLPADKAEVIVQTFLELNGQSDRKN